jgi:VanZ family protein
MKSRSVLRVFSLVALAGLAFVALGPASWQPRSGIGWELDHFAGYFAFTVLFCIAWPRPLIVGTALTIFAVVLEGLQAFMPDRSSYYMAAVYSAAGVISAALLAQLFILARESVRNRPSASKGEQR